MSRLNITFKRIISVVMLLIVVRVEPTEEQFNAERESLRNAVDNMIIDDIEEKTDYSLGLSFGTAENGEEFEELIIKADNMLYEQKAKIIIQDNFQIQGVFLNAISLS